jgi:hypothetical protein
VARRWSPAERGGADAVPSEAPHSPQKLALDGFSAPHSGQWEINALPHRMQNFLSAAFSKSQLEQRIGLPTEAKRLPRFLYHAGDSKGIANQACGQPALDLHGAGRKQMRHGLVGRLYPLSFFHDLASSPAALKKTNSINKLKTIDFRDYVVVYNDAEHHVQRGHSISAMQN